jgi:hypothetical protein
MIMSVREKTKLMYRLVDEVYRMVPIENDTIVIERLEHLTIVIKGVIKQLKKGVSSGSVLRR